MIGPLDDELDDVVLDDVVLDDVVLDDVVLDDELVVPHEGTGLCSQVPCMDSPLPERTQVSVVQGLWSSQFALEVHEAAVEPPVPMCTPPP
jgi:hypothetical protein